MSFLVDTNAIATRNAADFAGAGLRVVNPFM